MATQWNEIKGTAEYAEFAAADAEFDKAVRYERMTARRRDDDETINAARDAKAKARRLAAGARMDAAWEACMRLMGR
jgi:hypothetical protein